MLNTRSKNELIDSINVFCKNFCCANCGGSYDFKTFTCLYCHTFNEDLKRSYENIVSIFSNLKDNDVDDEIFLYLYKLDKVCLNNIDFSLDKFNLDSKVKDIINRLEGTSQYSGDDIKLLEYIFSNDEFISIDFILRDKIIKNVILGKNNLSKSLIEKVISHLVLIETRKISKNSKFYIENLDDSTLGSAFYYFINLDRRIFDSFYENGDIRLFYVLPHEMQHVYRNYLESKGVVTSYLDLLALKEHLLRKEYNDEIYSKDQNYVKNLHEIEANIFSYYAGSNYLRSLGFDIKEEDAILASGIVNNDLVNFSNPLREIDGKLVDINNLFSDFIKNKKSLFLKFPQLHYEFKEEEGEIVYKSKEELVEEFMLNQDNSLEEIYLSLIRNAIDRESDKRFDSKKN